MTALPERMGKLIGRILYGVAEGVKPRPVAKPEGPRRKFVVSVTPNQELPVHGNCEARSVEAVSEEQAAELRVGELASELHAMGAPSNGVYEALVEGRVYRVSCALMHRTEVVGRPQP